MKIGELFERYKVEIMIVTVVISLIVTNAILKRGQYEPPYVAKLTTQNKEYCRSKARESSHNMAIFGGADAEYYVALEDCVRRVDPDAFKR